MKELRVALIGGAGFMGRAHSMALALAPMAHALPVTVVKQVLVDVDPDAAAQSARELGWSESASDWREVVRRGDIDVVDIVTPPQFHAEIAFAALAAGKHVFCEKPISNDADVAVELAREAARAGVVTQVGFNYRHASAIEAGRQLLDSGRLGKVLEFRGSFLNESGFTGSPDRWRARRSRGGSGATGDIGSHVIDIAQHLAGRVTRVSALVRARGTDRIAWRPDAERVADDDLIDDTSVFIAEFESGAIGSFSVSSFASGRKNRVFFELDAEHGAIEFDWNRREEFRVSYTDEPVDHQGFRTIHTNLSHPKGVWRIAGLGTGYADISAVQFAEFIRAIVDGGRGMPDFADAARVQLVVDAVHRSAAEGRWVDVQDIA